MELMLNAPRNNKPTTTAIMAGHQPANPDEPNCVVRYTAVVLAEEETGKAGPPTALLKPAIKA